MFALKWGGRRGTLLLWVAEGAAYTVAEHSYPAFAEDWLLVLD